jgi:pimeloyl-ACP methyl ester carboxylesterase
MAGSPAFITALVANGENLYAQNASGAAFRFDGERWQAAPEFSGSLEPARLVVTLPERASPKAPVVLIHGLGDSNRLRESNLRFLARWLKADGYPVHYVEYSPNAPLLANAGRVAAVVEKARAAHPGQAPVLIAHSFGGLLARAYLASHPGDVSGLITLGTPHAGAQLAYDFIVPELASNSNPQWRELLPEHTQLLDPFWGNELTPQLHVAGDILPRENFFEGFPPHDGIVDAASAVAAPGATRIFPLLHGWTISTMRYGIDSYLYPKALYAATLRPFLASLERVPPADRALTPLLNAPGFTHTPLYDGTLGGGETTTLAMTTDAPPATWFLDGAGVEMTLVAPDGERYDSGSTGPGATVAHLPYRDNVLQPLDLWSTELTGTWQVELTNRRDRPAQARLTVVQLRKAEISVQVATAWVAPGDDVIVEAQAAPGQSLRGSVGDAEVVFEEPSPGNYRATFPAPTTAGYHALYVTDGAVARWAVVTVRSERFRVGDAEVVASSDRITLRLPVAGAGNIAVGARIIEGENTIAARFQQERVHGAETVVLEIPVLAGAEAVRVEWQLFDATGELIPVTVLNP